MKCSKVRPVRPTSVAQRSSASRASRRARSGRPRLKSARQKYHWSNATQKKQRASPRYTLTLYDKATEIRKQPLSPHLEPDYRDKLTEWATGKVRVELSIRHHVLPERDLRNGVAWIPTITEALLDERLM